jgi:hypothetical protein
MVAELVVDAIEDCKSSREEKDSKTEKSVVK